MMKRFFLTLSVLVLSLMTMTAFAQDKKCSSCNGCGEGCAVARADKIATIFSLGADTKAQVLELNRGLMAKCADKSDTKAFKKEMKAAKKSYDKSLKQLIGKKNFRKLKSYDKVEFNALKAEQKAAAKAKK